MRTRFQSKSSSKTRLKVPINVFSFAAYSVQVNRLFHLLPLPGGCKRNREIHGETDEEAISQL
jgi:hypothetical protein